MLSVVMVSVVAPHRVPRNSDWKRNGKWKDCDVVIRARAHWLKSQQRQSMCKHKLTMLSLNRWCRLSLIQTCFEGQEPRSLHLVAEYVMEGSMVFCQKNILEHSMRFHGNYLKRCLLTHYLCPAECSCAKWHYAEYRYVKYWCPEWPQKHTSLWSELRS